MARSARRPGPYAQYPDGYCAPAGGVIRSGHVMTLPTARFARDVLIDPGRGAGDRRKAFTCLETVISSQISEPEPGAIFDPRGTWPWSVGDTMGTGASFNYEDFIGTTLTDTFRHDTGAGHGDWPAGLADRLRQCLINAVRCSHNRRVRVSYTNPLAMSIECSALTGEMFEIPEFVEYARERLDEWIAFTDRAGTFEEFNSSCYGGITMPHTAVLAEHARDADVRGKALYMERKYFDHVCDFYHHPTGEASMPRSRAYRDRFAGSQLAEYLRVILLRRRPGAFPPPKTPPARQAVVCSHATDEQIDRLLDGFDRPRETRVCCEWTGCDHVGPLDQVPPPAKGPHTRRRELVAWRTAEFCIGSVNEIDSWQQRRAIGGYIRTPGGSAMVAWKPKIEVAGTEEGEQQLRWPTLMYFNLCCGQERGTILAGVTGAPIDGQWLCGSHWRQKVTGAVEGVSVDLGFEIEVPGLESPPPELKVGEVWRHDIGGCTVSLLFMGGRLGAAGADPAVRGEQGRWRLSLLRKEAFRLDWAEPPDVALAFVLDCSPAGRAPDISHARWHAAGTDLAAEVTVGGKRLSLRYSPPGIEDLTRRACFFSPAEASAVRRE